MTRTNAALLLTALLFASCSQQANLPGDSPSPSSPVTEKATGTATVRVFIPSVAPQGLRPQYLPGTTTGLRVRLGIFDQTFPVGAGQAGCEAVTGGVTCTFTLTVPAGEQTLRLDALDAANHVLSTASQTVTVVKGQNNAFNVLLTGVPAAGAGSLGVTSRPDEVTGAAGNLTLDRGGAFSLSVALRDASGQTIINPGLPTFKVCSSNAAFSLTNPTTETPTLTAPEPTGTTQSATLYVPADGNCATTTGPLANVNVSVPAFHLALSVPASVVAGSSAVTSAQLRTALDNVLNLAGRTVAFSTSAGSMSAASATTDATGQASVNLIAPASVTTGTVTASSDGVTANASFTTTAGTADDTTSTVVVSPDAVKVGQTSTVTVTLKDANGNPVNTTPTLSATGGAVIGTPTASGNVFTFPVTAPATPATVVFTARVGSSVVGTGNLAVTPYALLVRDGTTPVAAQYDFTSAAAKTFAVSEQGYAGAFTVQTSNTNVTASLSGGTLTVTPVRAGLTTITVQDAYGQEVTFDVSVTTVSITVY